MLVDGDQHVLVGSLAPAEVVDHPDQIGAVEVVRRGLLAGFGHECAPAAALGGVVVVEAVRVAVWGASLGFEAERVDDVRGDEGIGGGGGRGAADVGGDCSGARRAVVAECRRRYNSRDRAGEEDNHSGEGGGDHGGTVFGCLIEMRRSEVLFKDCG